MKVLGVALETIVGVLIGALLFAFPVMWLWNWLMPTIFELCTITLWQALGLGVLSGLLLKNSNGKD